MAIVYYGIFTQPVGVREGGIKNKSRGAPIITCPGAQNLATALLVIIHFIDLVRLIFYNNILVWINVAKLKMFLFVS